MVFEAVGNDGAVYAQDISDQMVIYAAQHISKSKKCINIENIYFNVSNASHLPFADGYFDAAYHFGGINLFSNIALALQEMCRVVRVGGTIVVGDEGVAPWLKDTEYGKIVINNNPLWSKEPPLGLLPQNICNLNLTWVLGNCFYVMDFEVANSLPTINMNVPHKGVRGGTMEKRYFGRLEGVSPSLRDNIAKVALQSGLSQSDWLEHHLGQLIKK
jgi:SAM-dependent methyltransferase